MVCTEPLPNDWVPRTNARRSSCSAPRRSPLPTPFRCSSAPRSASCRRLHRTPSPSNSGCRRMPAARRHDPAAVQEIVGHQRLPGPTGHPDRSADPGSVPVTGPRTARASDFIAARTPGSVCSVNSLMRIIPMSPISWLLTVSIWMICRISVSMIGLSTPGPLDDQSHLGVRRSSHLGHRVIQADTLDGLAVDRGDQVALA